MAELPQKVAPGDLILATQLNELIDYAQDLETRIIVLEAGGAAGGQIRIFGLSPGENIRIGQELRVIGQGFGIPALNIATIESTTINGFKVGSHNNLLIFNIPAIAGIPAAGKDVTLTVSGPNGFDAYQFRLSQVLPDTPAGTLLVQYIESPPVATLAVNTDYDFIFSVRATVNMNETYNVIMQIEDSVAGWTTSLFNPVTGNEISPAKISIDPGSPPTITTVNIGVRVHIPAAGTQAKLHVRVVAERNQTLAGEKRDLLLNVGSPPPAPGPVSVFLNPLDVLTPGHLSNGILVVPVSAGLISATFQALIKNPGSYVINPLVIDGDPQNKWSALLGLGDSKFTTTAENQLVSIPVGITSAADAPDAHLIVSVASQADAAIRDEMRQAISIT